MILINNWIIKKKYTTIVSEIHRLILDIEKESISNRGCFNIILAGGKSFNDVYSMLSKSKCNWKKWNVFLGDERFSTNLFQRNDYLIKKNFLDKVKIPKKNIHFYKTQLAINSCINNYERKITPIKMFDIVLLGMGEDGHTASLFPFRKINIGNVVFEGNSPKLPKKRLSLAYKTLNKSRNSIKLIYGKKKRKVLRKIFNGLALPIVKVKGQRDYIFSTNDTIPKRFKSTR